MRRRQAAPPAHAYPTYPEERKPVPTTPYVPPSSAYGGGRPGGEGRSYLPNHPSSGGTGGAQHYSGGDLARTKTFVQTASLHGKWAWKGLQDACKVQKGWDLVVNDARLRGNLIKSLLINIPFLLFLLFLSFVILPLLSKAPSRSENPSFLAWLLRSPQLWQFLGTGGVVLVNGAWQGKIAERAWGLNSGAGGGGMGANGGAVGGGSLSTRTLLLLDYILLTSLFRLLPFNLGSLPAFLYTLLVNAYYCFEHTLSAQAYTLPERISFLQTRSSYFAGFALPLTILTTNSFLPPLLSTTLFALLYPVYLILASGSNPLPRAGSSAAFGGLPVSGGGAGGGGEEGGEEEEGLEGGGHEGDWWEWWPRKVRVLEGGLWAVEAWEGLRSGMMEGGTGGYRGGGHRRKGSRM